MPNVYELSARFDSRKSFYGKAQIMEEDIGGKHIITLLSYSRPAARLVNGKFEKLTYWKWSNTTSRHCYEFCKQFNVPESEWR